MPGHCQAASRCNEKKWVDRSPDSPPHHPSPPRIDSSNMDGTSIHSQSDDGELAQGLCIDKILATNAILDSINRLKSRNGYISDSELWGWKVESQECVCLWNRTQNIRTEVDAVLLGNQRLVPTSGIGSRRSGDAWTSSDMLLIACMS